MSSRRCSLTLLVLFPALGWLGAHSFRAAPAPAGAQKPADQTSAPVRQVTDAQAGAAPLIIKTESNLVLVDAIVTDKKGNYVQDLEVRDFRVFEDDKEQAITSFSKGSQDSAPNAPEARHYFVLFFDNSTMAPADQANARKSAIQFVEKNASPNNLIALGDFGGVFNLSQNFTANANTLKRHLTGFKFSALQPNVPGQNPELASLGLPSSLQTRSDFAARSVLLAIRSLSRTLRSVPGRKALILFSAGFPLNSERMAELTATIDAANKANVAIYAIDVRGLQGLSPLQTPGITNPAQPFPGFPPGASLRESLFPHEDDLLASLLGPPKPLAQRGSPGGGGGGGPRGGGGGEGGVGGGPGSGGGVGVGGGGANPGGGRGTPGGGQPTGTAGNSGLNGNNPYTTRGSNNPFDPNQQNSLYPQRSIIPPIIESATTQQQVLYALAEGTGGRYTFNTNDFSEGLAKALQDMHEYYVLGYAPRSRDQDGSYHKINVKMNRKGLVVRARNGYYDTKSQDLLAGKPEGKVLEGRAASSQSGDIPVSVEAPYFYTSANVARVNLALEIPASNLDFQKEKGEFHAEVNVLGIAYREDGSVSARFSDTVKRDVDKKGLKNFSKGAFTYQNNFDIAPGKYNLKVVLSAGGQKFGKIETPLVVGPFDGKHFDLSGLALSDQVQPIARISESLNEALLEERTPLVVKGMEIIPSPSCRFKRDEKVALYVEVYEPAPLIEGLPHVGITMNIFERKTNRQVFTTNTILVNGFAQEGSPVIPVGVKIPVDQIQAGDYRLEVQARDSAGNASQLKTAEFVLE